MKKIIIELSDSEYVTASELAKILDLNEKTVRTTIGKMRDSLDEYGIEIESKTRKGYHLLIYDKEKYQAFINNDECLSKNDIPNNSKEREEWLLDYLLKQHKFVRIDDLSEMLYVSRSTITNDIRNVEDSLKSYHITLIRRPNYGLHIQGSEFDIRNCMISQFKDNKWAQRFSDKEENELKEISKILLNNIQNQKVVLSKSMIQEMTSCIYIAKVRYEENYKITVSKNEVVHRIYKPCIEVATNIVEELNEKFHIHLLDSEIYYIAINIAARSDYNVLEGELESGVINQARKQATQMLDCVYDMMHLDMRQNLSLLYDLISFLIPMDIRMRYGIIAKNPFAEATKKKYFFAYNVASQAVIPLKKTYFHEVPENEIAYLTSIFALFIEQEKDKKKKYNILVICATNMSTSKLLAYQYKKKFKKYIDEVYTCEMYNLDSFDFSKVDYIFTTVEINRVLPKPVLGISAFLEDEEVEKISSILKFKSSNTIADVYSEELFYDNIKGETKEEILFEICKRIPEKYGIPSDFYEGLLRREEITGTDLAKHVALPHPYETTSDISFACISVLDHPIRWTRQDVQVVILMAVAEDEQRDLTNFLQLISEFIANESAVLQLVEEPDFTTFVNLLSQIEM
ncbi:BglG family transcription antiterminator [Anaerostipes hadrus]|nr:PRD domain-containing protein [Anaerostipes hadrus]NSG58940.1 BglG family transcription antiterminator [Anaerostipes hadrus]